MARPAAAAVAASCLGSATAFVAAPQTPSAAPASGGAAPVPKPASAPASRVGGLALPCAALAAAALCSTHGGRRGTRGLARAAEVESKLAKPGKGVASKKLATADKPPPKAPKPPYDGRNEIGAWPVYFDPLNMVDYTNPRKFWRMRDYEIKHGRAAMLAAAGLVVQHYVHWDIGQWDTWLKTAHYSMGALTAWYGPNGFFGALLPFLLVGLFIEGFWFPANQGREAGNFGNPVGKFTGLDFYNDQTRFIEIVNGRFAMICVIGIFAAELNTGKDGIEQLGLA